MIPKTKKVNLSEQIVDTITGLIEDGTWKAGDKLPNEIELAASFEVSRNILREAMKSLQNFGVIDSRAGIGTYITENALTCVHSMQFFKNLKSNVSIDKILEARLLLEPQIAYLACQRATEEDIRKISVMTNLAEERWNRHNGDYPYDFNLHLILAQLAGNYILEDFLKTLLSQLECSGYNEFNDYTKPEELNSRFEDHKKIVEAMKAKDPELTRSLMYEHLHARITAIHTSCD